VMRQGKDPAPSHVNNNTNRTPLGARNGQTDAAGLRAQALLQAKLQAEVRKTPASHDEPCKSSDRLSRQTTMRDARRSPEREGAGHRRLAAGMAGLP
jgi:hypothetical protein